jgi:2-C-methyl-D-erythritol 4-phosphate cytidylyltransferase
MIVVAGGSSTRFGADKLMMDIDGRPLIDHTIDAVIGHVDVCVVVCRPEISQAVSELRDDVRIATGGATRTSSEMAGLAAIGDEAGLIGIHDAARPVVDGATVARLFDTAAELGGALPLLEYERIILDRRTHRALGGLHRAQTPQVFRGPELMVAYVKAARAGFEGHDTVDVMQRFGDVRIVGIEGSPANVKVTYPDDFEIVRQLLTGPSRI